ncbi:MAG TPA: sodium:proton antiporter [Desulfopila sp.]|nr:sodium:proton antiporter [Desulfopila sp.]
MNNATVPLIATLFILCGLCQWLAWRIRLPAILLLLLTGIGAGPMLKLFQPEELLGDLLFPFVSLSVAIILFEGSLTLKFREIRGLHAVVRNMVSFGMATTWLITTLATKLFLEVSWEVATLFGAIMVVTGPTVVAPILRTVRPVSSVANILKWESIVIDPIGATLAVLVFEFIISGGGQHALGHTLLIFGYLVFMGSLIGCVAGFFLGMCLRYHIIPEFLHNVAALGLVFGSFALANHFQAESGLVAVTVFGIWLANMKNVDLEYILAFKETLSILLISLLFIILAARLDIAALELLGWKSLLICAVIQFLARPLSIAVSTWRSNLSRAETHFLAWIAPRGIVAAAISSLFALKLQNYGHADAALLVPLTFVVIIFTVLLQSLTAYPIARMLKITLPEADGFLIVGGNKLARAIVESLRQLKKNVIVVDNSHRGKPEVTQIHGLASSSRSLSERTGGDVELAGLGTLLALSHRESDNIAAAYHYRQEFGRNNTYVLPARAEGKHHHSLRFSGKTLFDPPASYARLEHMITDGAEILHTTQATKYTLENFQRRHGRQTLPLFAVDLKQQVHFFTSQSSLQPGKNWIVYYLGHADRPSP